MRSALLYNVSNLILVPWELAAAVSSASLTRRRETYETILVDVLWCSISSIFQRCSGCEISEKKTIFGRKIWFTSGFHCADIARKLVFPSKLLFYMPDHQEFPAFCTRFFRGCSCHVGSADESRRTFHRTRVPMKELRGRTSPVWHWEGAALGTGNLDMSSDHGGGWWLALAGSWYNIWLDSITGYRRWFATTEALALPPATAWEASACQNRHGKNRH